MRKRIAYVSVTIILTAVIFFCFSATAYSQSLDRAMTADREGIELQEQEITSAIREVMEEYGCKNSGITMTKIFREDGGRDYEILINHHNISYISVSDMAAMEAQLIAVTGQWEDVTFCYKFTDSL